MIYCKVRVLNKMRVARNWKILYPAIGTIATITRLWAGRPRGFEFNPTRRQEVVFYPKWSYTLWAHTPL